MHKHYIAKYQTSVVNTSDTIGQIVFIFEEIIKILYTTKAAMADKDFDTKYKNLTQISKILVDVRSRLEIESHIIVKMFDDWCEKVIFRLHHINVNSEDPETLVEIIDSVKMVRTALIEASSG